MKVQIEMAGRCRKGYQEMETEGEREKGMSSPLKENQGFAWSIAFIVIVKTINMIVIKARKSRHNRSFGYLLSMEPWAAAKKTFS